MSEKVLSFHLLTFNSTFCTLISGIITITQIHSFSFLALVLPEDELYAEPDDDDDLEVEERVLDLFLEIVILDGGEHAQAETQEDDHKAVQRTQRKLCIIAISEWSQRVIIIRNTEFTRISENRINF